MPEFEEKECGVCGGKTEHRAIVRIIAESETGKPFSKEPYRILKCTQCGENNYESRMNSE